jgi:hemerythrin-like metal-binding protein
MLEWSSTLETGNDNIDRQHREIFAKLNSIEAAIHDGADRECLLRLITALLDYSYVHFHHEEHAMSCSRCPFQGANCEAHEQFILRLRGWLAVIMAGGTQTSLLKEIHAESCHWIKNHIEKVDIGLLQHRGHGAAPIVAE